MPHPIIQAEVDEFRKKISCCTHVEGFHTCVLDDKDDNESYKDRATEYFAAALHRAVEKAGKVDENTSDGYHTFKELYEFRLLYNATLFNEWTKQGLYNVHKSQRHFDGELCFGRDDYFVVVAELPSGQISNHYPMSDWDLFQCPAVEKALAQWDGHDAKDVATRLRSLALSKLDTIINFKENEK